MKCEHCGKNEVSFVYRSNINGKVTEKHLCQDCAEKLGYSEKLLARQQRLMDSLWGADDLFGGSLLGSFFAPGRPLLGSMDRFFGEDLFDDFFREMPALGSQEKSAEKAEEKDQLVEEKERSRFAAIRERNALKLEQRRAIREENFERAAELRDQIRALEEKMN